MTKKRHLVKPRRYRVAYYKADGSIHSYTIDPMTYREARACLKRSIQNGRGLINPRVVEIPS